MEKARLKWKQEKYSLFFLFVCLFYICITTEIFLYRFEYFHLHYITRWLVEAMFVNFLSWATCDKDLQNVGSG